MIQFFSEDIDFDLPNKVSVVNWITETLFFEKKSTEGLSIIFCSDKYLHELNVKYLDHDTLTDIITFPYHNDGAPVIEGDIFISIDRIKENSKELETSFEDELHRVVIHGVLHLCGYGDKTDEEKKEMRRKENESLQKRNFTNK